jgi:hypothetical protein
LRIPVAIFVIGIIILIGGIVLAFVVPATVTWQPNSKTLASEKLLVVSSAWQSKRSKLVDEAITVPSYRTYDDYLVFQPFILEDAKNFEILGNATEQSSPQRLFNLYVFDDVNFDLWEAGKTYTAFYEAKGKTSDSFSIALIATKEELPFTFYFVVEECAIEVKPTVRVIATIMWIEKALSGGSAYFTSPQFTTSKEAKDFVLKGTATEINNNIFDFYIGNWIDNAYTGYYSAKNIPHTSFSVPLTKEQAELTIYFQVENPLLDVNENVNVSAILEWSEKATIAVAFEGINLGSIIALLGIIVIIIAGIAALVFKPKAPAPTPPTPPTQS